MREPADLLILDEPTNDLDIPTLDVLEESLAAFEGGLVLVTHDRFMLDRIVTVIVALDGQGGPAEVVAVRFALKFSTDPQLEARVRDVVGLYLDPRRTRSCSAWTRSPRSRR